MSAHLTDLALQIVSCKTFRIPCARIGFGPLLYQLRRHDAESQALAGGVVVTDIRALGLLNETLAERVVITDDYTLGLRVVLATLGAPARSMHEQVRRALSTREPLPQPIRHRGVAETVAEAMGGSLEARGGGFMVAVDIDTGNGGLRLYYGQGMAPCGHVRLGGQK